VRWSGAGAQAPEEGLGEQGLLSLMKADFGGPNRTPQYLRGSHQGGKARGFTAVHGGKTAPQVQTREVQTRPEQNVLPPAASRAWEQAAQRDWQSPSWEAFQSRLGKTLNNCAGPQRHLAGSRRLAQVSSSAPF